jgi:hypothetical protein
MKNDNTFNTNLKYLSRCHYYGKLLDYEFVSDAMVLVFSSYVASSYFGGTVPIRIYVPTELETQLQQNLIIGENYYIIAVPYRIQFKKQYRHRVDLLISITAEVI